MAFSARGASGAQSSIVPAMDAAFAIGITQSETMTDMLHYMPPEHIELINRLKGSRIREYLREAGDEDLYRAYNAVIDAVATVRNVHYHEIIQKYIVPFRPPEPKTGISGTGGTDLTQFLPKNIEDTKASAAKP